MIRTVLVPASAKWLRKRSACFARPHSGLRKTSSSQGSSSGGKFETPGFLSSALAWYSRKLDTHPITTKCITSGLISGTGDLICQYLTIPESKDTAIDSLDMIRTGRFAALGTLWVGPILHYWYGALFRWFPQQVLLRVAVDQLAFAPLFITSFLSWLWTLEGEQLTQLASRLRGNVPSIVVANWSLWIPAQAVNFYFLKSKYHVLFSNVVALLWNAYLSFTSHATNPNN